MDSSFDKWIEKPEERGITLLVTAGTFEMPGPEDVKRFRVE